MQDYVINRPEKEAMERILQKNVTIQDPRSQKHYQQALA